MTIIAESDPDAIARAFLEHQLTLVEMPDDSDDGQAALTAEVDGFHVIIAFSSQERAQQFAEAMPDLVDSHDTLSAFVVPGCEFLENLPDELGILLNAECEDTALLPPDLVQEIKQAARALMPERSLAQAVRQESLDYLNARGFRPAEWLPLREMNSQLRSTEEIAQRLMGLASVFTWVSAPADAVTSETVQDFIQKNRLQPSLTPEDIEILSTPRAEAQQQHADSVGWRLENMWPLAWVLGFDPEPTIEAAQINPDTSRAILFELLAGLTRDLNELLAQATPRSVEDVVRLEDRFYCAHNAVREAQLGEETVPSDFHPVVHGGTVHERRHSLTWCLSPGTSWDETDLST